MKKLVSIAVALAAAACVTDSSAKFLRNERVANNYTQVADMGFTGGAVGQSRITLHMRTFESNGNVGMCAFYIDPSTNCDRTLSAEWFRRATYEFDGQKVALGNYLRQSTPAEAAVGRDAGCIETNIKWQPKYASAWGPGGAWLRVTRGDRVSMQC
jgi:hypothetical protein